MSNKKSLYCEVNPKGKLIVSDILVDENPLSVREIFIDAVKIVEESNLIKFSGICIEDSHK